MMNSKPITAYLSIGSNMGDRISYLASAQSALSRNQNIKILKKSAIYETEPWSLHESQDPGIHPKSECGQMWFINQAVEIETILTPLKLLDAIQNIEKKIGRTKKHHWGPREIDIDILLYGRQVIEADRLTVPHRHMNDRQFVLIPLMEIAPDLKDPLSGKSYKIILQNIKDKHKVIPYL